MFEFSGCGSTETSCPAQMVLPPDHQKKFGSVGLLLSNLEARLVGENEEDVSEGEAGEMWIRGPTIMKVSAREKIGTFGPLAPFFLFERCTDRLLGVS